ncbi:MAG: hypothetical protein IJS12_03210 [Lachnospiraceae bacterium]|nr:hypothetical protein [Lachnospiraceae bacterium]
MDASLENTKKRIAARRKKFFSLLLVFVLLVSAPVIDSHAIQIADFDNGRFPLGIGCPSGSVITWEPGDAVAVTNFPVVYYRVPDGKQYNETPINLGKGDHNDIGSADTAKYTVLSYEQVIIQIREGGGDPTYNGPDNFTFGYWEIEDLAQNGYTISKIYLVARPSRPAAKNESKEEEDGLQLPPHEHTYTWIKTRETTEEVDGEWAYICECGDAKYRIPESGIFAFIKNSIDKIEKAPKGSTVEIKTSRWLVINKAVVDAISGRPDLTVKLSYLEGGFKGDRLITTIPAGTDLHPYLDEKGYVGFLYLKTLFPTERTAGK